MTSDAASDDEPMPVGLAMIHLKRATEALPLVDTEPRHALNVVHDELNRLWAIVRRAQGVLDIHTGAEQDAARFILTGEWKTPPPVR
jgi:hypothetical protein